MPRPIRAVVIILGAWLVVCELHGLGVAWAPAGPEKWLHLPMMGIGAALCIARGIIRPRERAGWILIGLAVLAWALGELYFTAVLWSDASPPVPSAADAGYLSLPPLIILGVVVLTRSRVRQVEPMIFVDGLIAGLAVGTWEGMDDIAATWRPRTVIGPSGKLDRAKWLDARTRSEGWVSELSALDF